MATKKTVTEEQPVEKRLLKLYELQRVLSEIDRIKTLRGELPLEVQDLEDELAGITTRMENINADLTALKTEIGKNKARIAESQSLIDKQTEQLNNVQNNREYDFLSKEIEFQKLEIEGFEKNISEINSQSDRLRENLASSKVALEEGKLMLLDKQKELDEIVQDTKSEEEDLRNKAKKLEVGIDERLLAAFKRIRKASRNGLGIVYVDRGACSGCFNKIPPQRQLDIRMHKKVIVCEYCGRIMIDRELAGIK